jgi:hypothetical protein
MRRCRGVAGGEQHAAALRLDQLGDRADAGGQHRQAGRHGLQDGHRLGLVVAGEHDHVRGGEQPRHIVAKPEHAHAGVAGSGRLHRLSGRALPGDRPNKTGLLTARAAHGVDEVGDPLEWFERGDEQRHERVGFEVEFAPGLVAARRGCVDLDAAGTTAMRLGDPNREPTVTLIARDDDHARQQPDHRPAPAREFDPHAAVVVVDVAGAASARQRRTDVEAADATAHDHVSGERAHERRADQRSEVELMTRPRDANRHALLAQRGHERSPGIKRDDAGIDAPAAQFGQEDRVLTFGAARAQTRS